MVWRFKIQLLVSLVNIKLTFCVRLRHCNKVGLWAYRKLRPDEGLMFDQTEKDILELYLVANLGLWQARLLFLDKNERYKPKTII